IRSVHRSELLVKRRKIAPHLPPFICESRASAGEHRSGSRAPRADRRLNLLALGPGWGGNNRFAFGSVAGPNDLVLSTLHLGDQYGMLVLSLWVESYRPERRLWHVELFERIPDRLRVGRVSLLDCLGRCEQRDIGLDSMVGRMRPCSLNILIVEFLRALPFGGWQPLGN